MITDKPITTIDNERPKPATVEAVREAVADCTLDPKATPRSNQARLLFSLYYCIGLPFPFGWREACVKVLDENGIPATTLSLDILHSAMLTDAVLDFEGWPGIDRRLVRDLINRQQPTPKRLTVKRPPKHLLFKTPPPSKPTRPRRRNEFDASDVERVLAVLGDEHSSRAVAGAMASLGFTGRRNLPIARAVCDRIGLHVSDITLTGKMKPSAH